MKPIKAWHFVTKDRRLRYGDNRYVRAGMVQEMAGDGAPLLCERGMHASTSLLDALRCAPGPIVCRVEIWGDVALGDDKLCGRFRRVLWTVDATVVLHEFACWCAERALRRAKVTDKRCWGAIEAKRAWLRGEISSSELDAARAAAMDAARAAASAAAWVAARAAAWAAAWVAAWAAAWAAALDAAWDAERKAQDRHLVCMLRDARRTA